MSAIHFIVSFSEKLWTKLSLKTHIAGWQITLGCVAAAAAITVSENIWGGKIGCAVTESWFVISAELFGSRAHTQAKSEDISTLCTKSWYTFLFMVFSVRLEYIICMYSCNARDLKKKVFKCTFRPVFYFFIFLLSKMFPKIKLEPAILLKYKMSVCRMWQTVYSYASSSVKLYLHWCFEHHANISMLTMAMLMFSRYYVYYFLHLSYALWNLQISIKQYCWDWWECY